MNIILSNFAGGETQAYMDIKEANESDNYISNSEWKALKAKYEKKNPDDFKKALQRVYKEGISANKEDLDEISAIVDNWNSEITETSTSTSNNLNEAKDAIEKTNPFNRTLRFKKPYMEGADVTALLTYLTNNGFDTEGTKFFGPNSFKALKDFQKNVLGFRKPDGKMDLDGKTMNYIIRDMNGELSTPEKNKKYGKDANELVKDLKVVDKYLGAFNKAFGGKGEILSRHNGIIMQLGRVFDIADNDVERLYSTLESDKDFKNLLKDLDGQFDKKTFAKELGLKENSEKFKLGVERTLIIALISLMISNGSTLALEIGAINYGENLKKGLKMNRILKSFGINVNVKEKMKTVLTSKETTVSGVNAILDVLNNPNMDTANLRRFMKEVYQPNLFQDTFGIFMPDGYEKVEELIATFEKTGTTEDAKNAVKEIYKVASIAIKKAEKNYSKAEKNYLDIPNDVKKDALDPMSIVKGYNNDNYTKKVHNATFTIRRYESAKEELALARQGLTNMGKVAGRYTNLDAKHDKIVGEKFNVKEARNLEKQIDSYLGNINLRKISRKELNSSQSFGKPIDINRVTDSSYMEDLLNQMKIETINGQTSVLSGLIRGVEQHYGISFTPDEFIKAFIQTAKPVGVEDNVMILSNLGRDKNQAFQGKIKGNLFKININGTDVYFKDKCINIVTVVNDLVTIVDSTDSVPILAHINTGYNGGGNNIGKGGKNKASDTSPGDTDATNIFDNDGSISNISGGVTNNPISGVPENPLNI